MSRSRVSSKSARGGWALAIAALAGGSGCTRVDSFAPVTPQGDAVANLFMLEMVLAFLVAGAVAAAVIYAMVRFRDRPGAPEPRQIHGNNMLEIAWTAAPVLVLVVLFVLMVRTMSTVEAEAASALRVRVIAHQWWWEYQYPELGIVTANEMYLPLGQPVRLELESADVVHNFWIPQFGWKKDNTPNHTTIMNVVVNEVGTFDGACTEFCGTQHAWMRIRAVVTPAAEFQAWAARAQPPPATASRGQQVFQQNTCISCHAISGVGGARVGPDLTNFGSRTTIGAGVLDHTPDNLRAWLTDPQRIKPGALMPGYPLMSDADMQALVEYLGGLK